MQVEMSITLPATPADVWKALTDPELTRQYFFDCEAISDWQVGSELVFEMDRNGLRTVPVTGVVRAVEPHVYLEHTCVAAGEEEMPEKHTIVTYRLSATDDGGTLLEVTQGPFDDSEPREDHESSWNHVLTGLRELLDG